MAAFAVRLPSKAFKVETVGSGWPVEDALIQYDITGNVAWTRHYFTSAPDSGDGPHDVEALAMDRSGSLYFAGMSGSEHYETGTSIVKWGADGVPERQTLIKRIWRGVAADGTEFGFDLGSPLKDGEAFWQNETARYVVRQHPEPVVEIPLDLAPPAAAGLAWAIGNLHLELSAEPGRLLTPDESAIRQLLDRLQVGYRRTTAVFHPGRFARGPLAVQELGPSLKH